MGKKCPTFYSSLTKTCFHNLEDSANLFLKFYFDVVKITERATKTEIEIGMSKYTRIVCQCYCIHVTVTCNSHCYSRLSYVYFYFHQEVCHYVLKIISSMELESRI